MLYGGESLRDPWIAFNEMVRAADSEFSLNDDEALSDVERRGMQFLEKVTLERLRDACASGRQGAWSAPR